MTSPSENEPAPKIIVDSDWKEQVAKEKETLSEQEAANESAADAPEAASTEAPASDVSTADDAIAEGVAEGVAEGAADDVATTPEAELPQGGPQLPPASFEVLISMLFTQAISALGQMPGPDGGQTKVDKPMAKHTIDTLEMLETKTKGNLSDQESKMLTEALHALRMTYVGVRG
ncbi:protein of unknown function [Neorhodopirellula lusitana]|uniref:DUF1844 domain-containing protein n=1 Tax=Neorhodopirellula lusitana TaxID=445327 RepID=A0ABY1QJW9_9BACT|nr:DUF1844 domain-containing protein [Neorhodopirellula lusitana]SMP70533.1 protein of unknown function [Neorhodopirellula lusitana]